jgi:hypothetical protein
MDEKEKRLPLRNTDAWEAEEAGRKEKQMRESREMRLFALRRGRRDASYHTIN